MGPHELGPVIFENKSPGLPTLTAPGHLPQSYNIITISADHQLCIINHLNHLSPKITNDLPSAPFVGQINVTTSLPL